MSEPIPPANSSNINSSKPGSSKNEEGSLFDLPSLSETQTEIMNVIWAQGEATVADIWKVLSERRDVARNTIQTLLSRLVDKGWLHYRVQGKIFHYRAAQPREATLRHMTQRFVETAFQGSTEGLVLALLETKPLGEEEATRIQSMITQAARRLKTRK